MKTLKFILPFIVFGVMSITGIAQETPIQKAKSASDLYWETKPIFVAPKSDFSSKNIDIADARTEDQELSRARNLIEHFKAKEIYGRILRDWGIGFWKMFPNDPRVYGWLVATNSPGMFMPRYFKNIDQAAQSDFESYIAPMDKSLQDKWRSQFNEILNSSAITKIQKQELTRTELYDVAHMKWRNDISERFDLEKWKKTLFDYLDKYNQSTKAYNSVAPASSFFEYSNYYGLKNEDLESLINEFINSKYVGLQRFATEQRSLLALKNEKFKLNAKDVNGKEIDLNNYRGKLVLLDFWGVGCTACIYKMPEIKKVWEKYKSQGFEVISLCLIGYQRLSDRNGDFLLNKKGEHILVPQNQLPRIKIIHHKIGAEWPLVPLDLRPGEIGGEICKRYGWESVPQLILLDRNGILLKHNGEMSFPGGLDPIIARYIKVDNYEKLNK